MDLFNGKQIRMQIFAWLISAIFLVFNVLPIYGAITNYPDGISSFGMPVLPAIDDQKSTGKVFFVSSVIGSNGNSGLSKSQPFATLDKAFDTSKVRANKGDIVFLMENHAETISAAAGADLDVAGVTIIGLGQGDDRPTFTFTTATGADIDIDAANIRIQNVVFLCNIASQTTMLDVNAAGAIIENSRFEEGSATGLTFIDLNGGSANTVDDAIIRNNYFHAPTAGNYNAAIELGEVADSVQIVGNYIEGDFDDAGIHNPTSKVLTDLLIANNIVANDQSGQHAIELVSACTGQGVNNRLYSDAFSTTLDPGSLKLNGNLASAAIDVAGAPIPALGDSTDNYIGTDSADNSAATTAIVTNEDGSVLERLEQIQEVVNKGTGTAAASNKSILDAIGMDGNAVITASTGQLRTADGTEFWTVSAITSSAIPNNTQTSAAITGASSGGDLTVDEVLVQCDGTGWAAPTNIEITVDNAKGLTGAGSPILLDVIAEFGANLSWKSADATTNTLPITLESGKKLFIHGDDAAGTGAGVCNVYVKWQRQADGATVAKADLP